LQSAGNSAEAAAIYDEVRQAEVPQQKIVEATRGAILARQQEGIPLLLEQFRSPDEALFQVALSTAREFPGGEVDRALSDQLARATPQRAALIIQAMADRPETVVLSAVVKAASEGPTPVRVAAIGALGRLGDASCLPSLLETALDSEGDLAQAAKATLAQIPGKEVDARIVALLPTTEGKKYPLLLELVGKRRIDATPALIQALGHKDPAVRAAALTALGETVGPQEFSVLITQFVSPQHSEDAEAAERALKAASIRMPDREACATELVAAIDRSTSVPTKGSLLKILAAVGGTNALAGVGAAAKTSDADLQDISSRLLGEWMTEDAAPVLLDLANTVPEEKIKVRALRGYIRIARQFVLPDEKRAEMCQQALEAAHQAAEKKLVLDVLKRYPTPEALKLAIASMTAAELKEPATAATLEIAGKLGKKGVDVKDLLAQADFQDMKVEIVKAEYGAGETLKDVTAVLQELAKGSPLITLPDTYNACLGGDPMPGSAKQLKIQYQVNGKSGEATFAEDALILLPMPK